MKGRSAKQRATSAKNLVNARKRRSMSVRNGPVGVFKGETIGLANPMHSWAKKSTHGTKMHGLPRG